MGMMLASLFCSSLFFLFLVLKSCFFFLDGRALLYFFLILILFFFAWSSYLKFSNEVDELDRLLIPLLSSQE